MCIFAVRKSHTVDTWRQSTLISQNPLSLNYNISAVFAPILLHKPSFKSSFALLLPAFYCHAIFSYYTKYSLCRPHSTTSFPGPTPLSTWRTDAEKTLVSTLVLTNPGRPPALETVNSLSFTVFKDHEFIYHDKNCLS